MTKEDDATVNEHRWVNLHKFGGSKAEQIEWGGNGTIDPGYSPVQFSPLDSLRRPKHVDSLHPATASS